MPASNARRGCSPQLRVPDGDFRRAVSAIHVIEGKVCVPENN